jgi:hypothetical protein
MNVLAVFLWHTTVPLAGFCEQDNESSLREFIVLCWNTVGLS